MLMKSVVLLLVHLIVSLVKMAGPGGARGLIAESLLLKHQLLIVNRGRKRAPNLTFSDRLLLGLGCLLIQPRRVRRIAVIVSPSSLLKRQGPPPASFGPNYRTFCERITTSAVSYSPGRCSLWAVWGRVLSP